MKLISILIFILFNLPVFGQTQNTSNFDSLVATIKDKKLLKYIYKVEDSIIRENLIGKWKDQNSTLIFYADGIAHTIWDDGNQRISNWEVKKRKIIFIYSSSSSTAYATEEYYVLYSSPQKMEYQSVDKKRDSTIWNAVKIE